MKTWSWLALMLCSFSVAAQTARKPATPAKPQPAKVQTAPAPAVVPLDEASLALADKVGVGKVPCELNASVTITRDEKNAGYFWLELGKQKFHMAPVATSTGALRLEDAAAGAVWLQLGNKSMLMHQKLGKRLADACVSDAQFQVAQAMERNPPASLLEDPVKKTREEGLEKAAMEAINSIN